jgi:hypothetical protein
MPSTNQSDDRHLVPVSLLEDAAKLWLAMDGLWFQAVEKHYGIDKAIELDIEAWRAFSPIEARRIMDRHGIAPGGGIEALATALSHRLYAHINEQEIERIDGRTLVLRMTACRVQQARERKGMPRFPCKPVGIVEYETFARTIDPRFRVRCLACPPDAEERSYYCGWEFTLADD